jgi:hypothetical protein
MPFKLGRRRPKSPPKLQLGNYLLNVKTPSWVDYSPKAAQALAQMYMNDQLGDCVIAGGGHVRGVTSGNAGDEVVFTDAEIVKMYASACGYQPGNPSTDQGCDEQQTLNYWSTTGFTDGVKLTGYVGVNAANQTEMQQACYLFENLYFGLELPDAYVNPFPSKAGFVWGVAGAPDPQNGHCIMGMGYNAKEIKICTWGMLGYFTWAAAAYYCVTAQGGECYTLLSPDIINKAINKAPNGLNWGQLVADLKEL